MYINLRNINASDLKKGIMTLIGDMKIHLEKKKQRNRKLPRLYYFRVFISHFFDQEFMPRLLTPNFL